MTLDDVLALAMRDVHVVWTLKEALRSPLVVADPFKRQLAEFLGEFVDKYDSLPKPGDYTEWLDDLDDKRQQGISQVIQHLNKKDVSGFTPEYVADKAIDVLKKHAAKTAVQRLSMLDEVELSDMQTLSEAVAAIEPITLANMANLREVDKWAIPMAQGTGITTGMHTLDRQIGGFMPGELVFILADSGVGKSAALINHGYAAAMGGYNVLHVTLELSQRASALRFYRRIAEASKPEFQRDGNAIRSGVKHWWRFVKGNYHLTYFDPYTFTPENLEQLIHLFKRQGNTLDVLILDYIDLMSPSASDHKLSAYEQLGRVSHRIRGFGQKYDFVTLSATQATRPKKDEHEFLSLSKMGDSYKKVRAADLVIGFVRTREEMEADQGRYQVLKVRESGGRGADIPLYVNLDYMMIADLDHPNVTRITGGKKDDSV